MSGANRLGYEEPVKRSLQTTPTPLRLPHKISPLITKTPPHQSTLHMQAFPDPSNGQFTSGVQHLTLLLHCAHCTVHTYHPSCRYIIPPFLHNVAQNAYVH